MCALCGQPGLVHDPSADGGVYLAGSESGGVADDPTQGSGPGAAQLLPYIGSPHAPNPFSGNQDIDAALIGSKWIGTSFTYSFPTQGSFYGANYASGTDFATNPGLLVAFNADQQSAARYAIGLVQSYTNLTFSEITETATTHARFRFAQTNNSNLPSAHAWFPANLTQAGDVWFGRSTNQPFY